ncbi:hypothetical protein [Chroococcidiopsis sp. SAG 2025]|nr:hypothetical protein [Chroococcidiopsis sp. SAG 2025]
MHKRKGARLCAPTRNMLYMLLLMYGRVYQTFRLVTENLGKPARTNK